MTNLTIKNFDSPAELLSYFDKYGRGDNFTLEQMEVIYNLFMEVAPDTVIDVIGICCEFTGYGSVEEAVEDLGYEDADDLEYNCGVYYASNGEVVVQE